MQKALFRLTFEPPTYCIKNCNPNIRFPHGSYDTTKELSVAFENVFILDIYIYISPLKTQSQWRNTVQIADITLIND